MDQVPDRPAPLHQGDRALSLLWRDRDLRFHPYDRLAASPHVDEILQEIDRDPTRIFWG